jgi:hypothetical protein
MMRLLHRATFGLVALCVLMGSASAFILVTEEEVKKYKGDEAAFLIPLAASPGGIPAIEVVNPQIMAGPVPSPVSIELTFRTDGTPVDIKSFQALYGGFKFDITDRILEKARVTASGLSIENAEIPKGTHRLFLAISDVKGRRTDRELRIQVQ